MNVTIIGANGKQGSLLVKEAVDKGYNVSAVAQTKKDFKGKYILKNVLNLTKEDLQDADVVINAIGVWDDLTLHSRITEHLINLLAGSKTRLLVVGGAGSLFVDTEKSIKLMDTPDFPKDYYALALEMSKAFEILKLSNINWTYFSPAAFFDATGLKSNEYVLGNDNLLLNSNNESYISYEDYATAMVAEIKNENYLNQRFTICSK